MTISTTCRTCGREFEADRDAFVAGSWRQCPDCRKPQPKPSPELLRLIPCEGGCGRMLRGPRRMCLPCMGFTAS